MQLMFRKYQWEDKTLAGLTQHMHPEIPYL